MSSVPGAVEVKLVCSKCDGWAYGIVPSQWANEGDEVIQDHLSEEVCRIMTKGGVGRLGVDDDDA